MPGSAPKGIKSQTPCLHHMQLQCPVPKPAGPTLLAEVFRRPRAAPGGPHGPGVMLQGGRWPEGAQIWSHISCTSEGLGPGMGVPSSTQMQRREAGVNGEGAEWPPEKTGLQTLGRWREGGKAGRSGHGGEGKGNSSHPVDHCGRASGCRW